MLCEWSDASGVCDCAMYLVCQRSFFPAMNGLGPHAPRPRRPRPVQLIFVNNLLELCYQDLEGCVKIGHTIVKLPNLNTMSYFTLQFSPMLCQFGNFETVSHIWERTTMPTFVLTDDDCPVPVPMLLVGEIRGKPWLYFVSFWPLDVCVSSLGCMFWPR